AQVLLFFGARRGHPASAYAYAEMNDPNHHSPASSLLDEPDAFQAFRWYSAALDGGYADASERLDALREWAQTAAAAGDSEAERLLLQWE
ncbi:MAG TPA: deoxyribonuclease, partial [Gammaproteobacteria bacterium]|nr:deoxyribonuclease [Gammaproteobacteria bacterium]